jgi:hypothetical protein
MVADQQRQKVAEQQRQKVAEQQRKKLTETALVRADDSRNKSRQSEILKNLDQRKAGQFQRLQQAAERKKDAARMPAAVQTAKRSGTTRPPAGDQRKTQVDRTKLARAADTAVAANPGLRTPLEKFRNNKPLTKSDLANIKQGAAGIQDPAAKAAYAKAFGVSGMSLSDNALQTIYANDKVPPLTPGEKTAVDKYLHGESLTGDEIAVLNNLQDRPNKSDIKAAFTQMNRDIRDQGASKNFLDALTNMGGGGGTLVAGGGLLAGGTDVLPPLTPSMFYPSDATAAVDPDVVTPVGSGVVVTLTSNYVPAVDPVGASVASAGVLSLTSAVDPSLTPAGVLSLTSAGDPGLTPAGGSSLTSAGDPGLTPAGGPSLTSGGGPGLTPVGIDDLGSVASSATALQTTRYLRLANARDEPVTVSLQYCTQTEDGSTIWVPGLPGADDTITFDMPPGATLDANDGDWRINASRVRIWAKSPTTDWLTFRTTDLWLVPEEINGQHAYEADDLQVFNYTLR